MCKCAQFCVAKKLSTNEKLLADIKLYVYEVNIKKKEKNGASSPNYIAGFFVLKISSTNEKLLADLEPNVFEVMTKSRD